jgi:hypothetical protein
MALDLFQPAKQLDLPLSQSVTLQRPSVYRVGCFEHFDLLIFAPAIQSSGFDEILEGRALSTWIGRFDRDANQAPGTFAGSACNGAHSVDKLVMGATSLVSMKHPEVALG